MPVRRKTNISALKARVKNPEKITPEFEEELGQKADELDKAHALSVLAQTEGGKLLVEALVSDVISDISTISSRYKVLSHAELMAYCAALNANLTVMLSITRSKRNKDALQEQLEEMLKE